MAKKDKKNKKAVDDDWENEIGEDLTQKDKPADQESPAALSTAPADDDFGGGLMNAIRKNAEKKKKKGKGAAAKVESPVEDAATPTGVDTPPPAPKAPVEVAEIDDDEFGPVKKGKKGKAVQPKAVEKVVEKAVEEPSIHGSEAGDDEETGGRVKSKKEKEKEKKEREKQRKKEQVG
jgi:translation initiation factor 5B